MPKFFLLSLLKKKNTIFEVVVCYFEVELNTAIQFLLQFSDCVTLRKIIDVWVRREKNCV